MEVLVVGQEVWEEWPGQTIEETAWRKQVKRQWREMGQATLRRGWNKDLERDRVYDRGWSRPEKWEKGSPGRSLLYLVTFTTLY